MNTLRFLQSFTLCTILALLGAGCTSKEKKVANALERGDKQYAAGNWEKAEIEYKNVLQLEPVNAQAIARFGQMYLDQGRIGLSVPFLLKARELLPTDLGVRLHLAKLYAGTGNLAGARTELEYLLAQKEPPPECWPLLAETVANRKELSEVRVRLEKRLSEKAISTVHVALALLDLKEQKAAEAEGHIQKALTLDPKSSGAHALQGALHLSRKELDKAEASFKAASTHAEARSPLRTRLAQYKLDRGDVPAAKNLLKEITTQTPDFLPPWMMLAQIAAADRDVKEATTLISQVLSKDGTHPEAILLQARLRLVKGEHAAAVTDMERALRLFPKAPRFHHQLALAQIVMGDTTKAIASLNQALTLAPGFSDAAVVLATLQISKGDTALAITGLQTLLKQRPDLIQAWLLLADAYRAQNALPQTLEVFTEVEKYFPGNPKTPLMAGQVLLALKKRDEARKAFEQALSRDANYFAAIEQLVNLDVAERKIPEALARVEALIAKDPKQAAYQMLLAQVHAAQKDFAKTEAALNKAIELQPEAPVAYSMLAGLYAANNRLPQALESLQKVVSKNPRDARSLLLIGMFQERLNQHQAAVDSYEKLLALNSKNGIAQNNVAWLYASRFNQLDKALAAAQKARELLPQQPQVADTLGWILYQKKQYTRALSLLKECGEKIPESAEVQYHLGMVAYMQGDEAVARTALKRALELQPNIEAAGAIKNRLAVLSIDPAKVDANAKASLAKALAENPEDPVAGLRLAVLEERSGAIEKAIIAYEAILKNNPKNTEALLPLLRLYTQKNDLPKALELGKNARKVAPEDAALTAAVGRVAFAAKDYTWALALLQEAARKTEDEPSLLFDLSAAAYAKGKSADAEASLKRLLEVHPSHALAAEARRRLELMDLYSDQQKALAGARTIETALKQHPNDGAAIMASAVLCEARRQSAEARKGYERMLELYPDFAPARRALALLLAEVPAEQEKAFELVTKARTAFPGDAKLTRALGILHFKRDETARAVTLLREAVKLLPEDAVCHYYLGVALLRQNSTIAGKEALNKALSLKLQPELAAEANKLLAPKK